MKSDQGDTLNLHQAAEELGVHYQTAYKWVRRNELPASVVRGRYVVTRVDLEAFRERRDRPVKAPARAPRRSLERSAERMYTALVAGDEATVRQVAGDLSAEGVSVVAIIQEVLVPALRRVGAEWRQGDLTIWVEHRASAVVERLLGLLHPSPRGRRRGTAVVAALSGDHHALPTAMAATALRSDNWNVHHLGCDVPPREVTDFVAAHDVDLVVLTVTNPERATAARRLAGGLGRAGMRTVVGAPGRSLDDLLEMARSA